MYGMLEFIALAKISPAALKNESDKSLINLHRRMHQFWSNPAINREEIVNRHIFILEEMQRRGFSHNAKGELDEKTEKLSGIGSFSEQYAPVSHSDQARHDPILLEDIMPALGWPIKLREGFVCLTGGLVANGSSPNDIDILLQSITDEELRRIVEFRIYRMLPTSRMHLVWDTAGPFTSHIPLYDLSLVRNSSFPDVHLKQYPSGNDQGLRFDLHEVLERFDSAIIQRNSIFLAGGIVNHGSSQNDLDVIIRLPSDEQLDQAVRFMIGRMFPKEERQFIHWLSRTFGSLSKYVKLYDLQLTVATAYPNVIPMTEQFAKQKTILDQPGPEKSFIVATSDGKRVKFQSNSFILADRRAKFLATKDPGRAIFSAYEARTTYQRKAGQPPRPVLDFSIEFADPEEDVLDSLGPGQTFKWFGLPVTFDGNFTPGLNQRGESFRLAIEELYRARKTRGKEPKLTKELALYSDRSGNPDIDHERCYICLFGRRPEVGETMLCSKVQGDIDVAGWCFQFLNQGREKNDSGKLEKRLVMLLSEELGIRADENKPISFATPKPVKTPTIGKFFEMPKPNLGARQGQHISLDSLIENAKDFPYLVSKKFDGIRLQIHAVKSDRSFTVFTEQGQNITSKLPKIFAAVAGLNFDENVILDAELERWENGKHIDREAVAGAINSSSASDLAGWVINLFDIIMLGGKPANEIESLDRLALLKTLSVNQSTEDAPNPARPFNLAIQHSAKRPSELRRLAASLAKKPGSEGIVAKPFASLYPLKPAQPAWIKFRKTIVVRGIVISRTKTSDGDAFIYEYGVRPVDQKDLDQSRVKKLGDKSAFLVGKTFSTKRRFEVGDQIPVELHNVNRETSNGKTVITGFLPRVVEAMSGKLDTAGSIVDRAAESGILIEKN